MPRTSSPARAAAQRLLARARTPAEGGSGPGDPIAAAEWVGRALAAELPRWFGPYGYHALLARALAEVVRTNSALAAVRVRGPSDPTLEGLADAARAHGDAAAEGAAAVLARVIELLGRLIGEDMAVNLVEQAVASTAPNVERVANEESPS